MKNIESVEEFVNAIREEKSTVMLFSADWCPDCRFLDTFIDEVVTSYAEKYQFYHVDRDKFPELCSTYDILGIPSFLVFKEGKIIGRFVSKLRKTRREVEDFLDQAGEATE